MKKFLLVFLLAFACSSFAQTFEIPFAQGSATSDTIKIEPWKVASLQIPESFNGDSLTYLVSWDGEKFYTVHDDGGNLISAVIRPERFVVLSAIKIYSFPNYLILKSHSTQAQADTIIAGRKGW